MKKNYFLCAILLSSISVFSQKTIIVNGGQFGNQSENANVVIYDKTANTYTTVDTIQTQSVQDVLIDGNIAYVAAQDSIIKYDLVSETRLGAASFNGASTKTFKTYQNELLVGNWYGRATNNLYIYNTSTMNLVDSIAALDKGAKSILIHNGFAYITQNGQTAGFQDTLGTIVRLDIANRIITDTISVSGYSGDFGELVAIPNGQGFYSFNGVSNTITTVNFANLNSATNQNSPLDIRMSSRSHWSIHNDTLFGRMGRDIASINLYNLQFIDTSIVDTAVTAFTYDTLNREFFVTYTNFSTVKVGHVFDANGNFLNPFTVGFSPEVIEMYFNNSVGINEWNKEELAIELFPNPAANNLFVRIQEPNARLRIFDNIGNLVLDENLASGQNSLDVSNLSSGSYFIQVVSKDKMSTKILIKSN